MSASLLPVSLLVAVALGLVAWSAWRPVPRRWFRLGIGGAAVIGAELVALRMLGGDASPAGRALAPGLVEDGLSRFVDGLVLVGVGALVLGGLSTRRIERVAPALAIGAFGVSLVGHAGDLIGWVVGLELAALASVVATRPDVDAARPVVVSSLLIAAGAAFVFGAVSDVDFVGLPERIAAVFNRWGGVQRYATPLPGQSSLPPAFIQELVKGMAPAALLFTGLVLSVAGLLVRLLVSPRVGARAVDPAPPRDVVAIALVLRQVAVLAALLRLHVALVHLPRLVNEPYGWNGALPTLGILAVAIGGWTALRTRSVAQMVWGLGLVPVGAALVGVAAAANYHGHRAWVDRPVSLRAELEWSTSLADHATGAVMLWMTAAVLGALTVHASLRAARLDGDEVADLEAIGRVHPWTGVASVVGVLVLVGAPPTVGALAAWHGFASLVEHTSLWRGAVALGVVALPAWLAAARWMAAALAGTRAGPSLGEGRRGSRTIALVLAAGSTIGAITTDATRSLAELGAGLSFGVGSERRVEWLDRRAELRDRTAGRTALAPSTLEPAREPSGASPGSLPASGSDAGERSAE